MGALWGGRGAALGLAASLLAGCTAHSPGRPPGAAATWPTAAAVAAHLGTAGARASLSFLSVDFPTASLGYAGGESCPPSTAPCRGALEVTRDGGATWEALGAPAQPVLGLLFLTRATGFAWGLGGLLRSVDGGFHWRRVLGGDVLFLAFSDRLHGWAGVGSRGHCASEGCAFWFEATADGGATWRVAANDLRGAPDVPAGPTTLPWAEYQGGGALGPRSAWVVGVGADGAAYLATADGGLHWRRWVPPGAPQGIAADVLPSGAGLAVTRSTFAGGAQAAFATADGGGTWLRLPGAIGPGSVPAVAPDGTRWLRSGSRAGVLGRADGAAAPGATFSALDPLGPQDAFAIAAGPAGGGVWRTADGGGHWSEALAPGGAVLPSAAISFASRRVAYSAGTSIEMTADGGRSWRVTGALGAGHPAFADIDFATARDGIAVSFDQTAWRTADGGATWHPVGLPRSLAPQTPVAAAGLEDQWHGWLLAGTPSGADDLYLTADGGRTWRLSLSDAQETVFASPEVGWATAQGMLLSTGDGGRTWRRTVVGVPPDFAAYGALAVPPQSRNAVWLWDPIDGEIAVSRDGGRGFLVTRIAAQLALSALGPPVPCTASGAVIEMAGGLWRTEDAGRSWHLIARLP